MRLHNAILATVAYADVFDYPLTEEEVGKWLIGKSQKSKVKSQKLKEISEIKHFGGYFFLNGRKEIVSLRRERRRWTGEKMQVAKWAATLLKCIPTIQLIGVTGALAMDNAHRDDDIDFYIVAAVETLWSTRFFATVLLAMFGLRRKPGDAFFRNKICLNMYVDERHLAVSSRERDLFSAHEVLQMKPLWDRNGIYKKFLKENQWAKHFLPNAWEEKTQTYISKRKSFACHLEPLARTLQLWYMRRRRTTEVVSGSLIRFHPHDARIWIRNKLAGRLAIHKIPLDKIFYAR